VAAPGGQFTTRERWLRVAAAGRPPGEFVRETRSVGVSGVPLRWNDTRADLVRRYAAWQRALQAAGVVEHDRVLIALPRSWATGWDCLSAAQELEVMVLDSSGCAAGDIVERAPTVLVATPTDARRLALTLMQQRVEPDEQALRLVVLTGEPGGSLTSVRRAVERPLGATCFDVYATTETGVVGWGCANPGGGLHLDESAYVVEAVDPDAETPRADGELGELVLSSRCTSVTAQVRYRSGDLVRLSHEACACGQTDVRALDGILGRVDERVTVRGTELLPSHVEQVVRRHPAVAEFQLRVYERRTATDAEVHLEVNPALASEGARARVASEVAEDLRRSLGVRLQCDVVPDGTLGAQDAARRVRRLSRQ
jgi:phenylacetate-CoA ligase